MNWIFEIKLNDVIAKCANEFDLTRVEEDCPQEVKERIVAEMIKASPLCKFRKRMLAAKSIAAVNRLLDEVFDEADRFKVWCGFEEFADAR